MVRRLLEGASVNPLPLNRFVILTRNLPLMLTLLLPVWNITMQKRVPHCCTSDRVPHPYPGEPIAFSNFFIKYSFSKNVRCASVSSSTLSESSAHWRWQVIRKKKKKKKKMYSAKAFKWIPAWQGWVYVVLLSCALDKSNLSKERV